MLLSSTFATSATVFIVSLFAVFPRKWYQSVSVVLDPGAGDATNGSATIAMTMEQATVAPTQLTIDVEATPPPPQAAGSR